VQQILTPQSPIDGLHSTELPSIGAGACSVAAPRRQVTAPSLNFGLVALRESLSWKPHRWVLLDAK
jgi:hypothetical protein